MAQQPPAVTGEPVVGQTLHATHASWTGAPTSYDDWWLRCDSSGQHCPTIISGASGLDYTPTAADVGHVVEFGEIAYNGAGESKPAFSRGTEPVFATPARHFTLVGPSGTRQFAYYLVESGRHRPRARDWRHPAGETLTVGHIDADVNPGQTIYFSPTTQVSVRFGNVARTLEPEGVSGKAYHVTAHTPDQVRVLLPSPGGPTAPVSPTRSCGCWGG